MFMGETIGKIHYPASCKNSFRGRDLSEVTFPLPSCSFIEHPKPGIYTIILKHSCASSNYDRTIFGYSPRPATNASRPPTCAKHFPFFLNSSILFRETAGKGLDLLFGFFSAYLAARDR